MFDTLPTPGAHMDRYDLGHNRMPIGLRFAFFKFHLRNVYFTWYYNRRNRNHARISKRT